MEQKKKSIERGDKIRIFNQEGSDMGTHTVFLAHWNEWNDSVPVMMETCCGNYIPTSAMDGHWEGGQRTGGWDKITTK